ncbi:MAG: S24/S26 family peptidase [Clostridia bacterium]|nr:S24/S26 family peptidase [Clostridia bacterium]
MENKQSFEEVLLRDGRLIYTNVGVSMLPLIHEGRDIIVIEKRDISKLKRYDVVLFKRENVKGRGEYVLHRIIKKLPGNVFYIVGDNCTKGEKVHADQILGVLTAVKQGGKDVDLKGFRYRAYVYLWCAPYHLRFLILHIKHFFKYAAGAIAYKLRIKKQ